MSKAIITESLLTGIADAIRGVNGSTDTYTPAEMATAISELSGSSNSTNGFRYDPTYKTVNGSPYRLIYNEDFTGKDIDRNYWTDSHFISRVEDRYHSLTDYYLSDSKLHLRIKENAPTRYTNRNRAVTAIQTGERNELHILTPTYHDVNPFWGLISQEGYYEARFKTPDVTVSGRTCAWWMVGIQEKSSAAMAEIDIHEIGMNNSATQLPHGQHKLDDADATEWYNNQSTSTAWADDYHTLGMLWENGTLTWYVDGTQVDTHSLNTPQYPMMTFFSMYRTLDSISGEGDIEYLVDYFRIYKKATTQASANVTLTSITDVDVEIEYSSASDTYTYDDDRGTFAEMPSWCYANWSDGSRTEHWVKWDPINDEKETLIAAKTDFTWSGYVYGLGTTVDCNITFTQVSSDEDVVNGYLNVSSFSSGYIDDSGDFVSSTAVNALFDDYYTVAEGRVYDFTALNSSYTITAIRVIEYDSSKNFIGRKVFNNANRRQIGMYVSPEFDSGTAYIRFNISSYSREFTVSDFESAIPVYDGATSLTIESGSINPTTGADEENPYRARTPYITLSGSTAEISGFIFNRPWVDWTSGCGYALRCYDSSYALVGSLYWYTTDTTVTLPTNTAYVRFFCQKDSSSMVSELDTLIGAMKFGTTYYHFVKAS